MSPRRIQMTRQRPWRHEHPDAVIVARPTRWGNPWRILPADMRGQRRVMNLDTRYVWAAPLTRHAAAMAVEAYRMSIQDGDAGVPTPAEIRRELAGRDLACWCPLGAPCHADVLLQIAAGGAA